MRPLKPSIYNQVIRSTEARHLVFNGVSCGLGELDDRHFNEYLELMSACNSQSESDSGSLREELIKGGFLVPEGIDEIDKLRAGHYTMRFGDHGFGLTIIPTFNCNFACDYCYEDSALHALKPSEGSTMTEEVQDRIVRLLEDRVRDKSAFTVTWYGGEPLMAKDIIRNLTTRFIDMCKTKKVRYRAGIITNGYLLSRETVQFLIDMQIGFIQVTIDGPEEVHNQRRCLRGGGQTYKRILENLSQIDEDAPIYTSIRINIDKRNASHIPDLLKDLRSRNLLFPMR